MINKTDCANYNATKEMCEALVTRTCENCSFYKDKQTAKKDRTKAKARLEKIGLLDYYKDRYGIAFFINKKD